MGEPSEDRRYGRQAAVYDYEYSDYTADIPFYIDRLQQREVREAVLDVGTGTGRVALPLARRGWRVSGIDVSPQMLRRARQRRRALDPQARARLRFMRQDAASFFLPEKFDAALITFSTLSMLAREEQWRGCLRRCFEHLQPGGVLLVDLFAPRMLERASGPEPVSYHHTFWLPRHDQVVEKWVEERWEPEHDVVQVLSRYQRLTRDRRLLEAFEVQFELVRLRQAQVVQALLDLGFRQPEIYGDYQCGPFTAASERMIFEAARGEPLAVAC